MIGQPPGTPQALIGGGTVDPQKAKFGGPHVRGATNFVYLETSAFLEAVLSPTRLQELRSLQGPYVASHLTFAEAYRVLRCIPLQTHRPNRPTKAVLDSAWQLVQEFEEIVDPVPVSWDLLWHLRDPLPGEAQRSLDAIHLITLAKLLALGRRPRLVYSDDVNFRRGVQAMGLTVFP